MNFGMTMTSMINYGSHIEAALDTFVAEPRRIHRACMELLLEKNATAANQVKHSHTKYIEIAGTPNDPIRVSYEILLKRLGVIAEKMPSIVVATIPQSGLWAATGSLGIHSVVTIPLGFISFFRVFCTIVFHAHDLYKKSPELTDSTNQLSQLLGEHLELGRLNLSGIEELAEKKKPIIEHITQLACEFFILHEACHVRDSHIEPIAHETTFFQEAHLRHVNEFAADRWAFNTLLSSFSNDLNLVAVAIAMLFDCLDLLERYDFAPMTRLSHPSPAARKWHLIRLLEAPDALFFLDKQKLQEAKEYSLFYERLAAFIVDRAKPTTPLNKILELGEREGSSVFVEHILSELAKGNPKLIIENLARIRATSFEWAEEGTSDDYRYTLKINECVDILASELQKRSQLKNLASILIEAATWQSKNARK